MGANPIKGIVVAALTVAAVAYKPIMKPMKHISNLPNQKAADLVTEPLENARLIHGVNGFDELLKAGKLNVKKAFKNDQKIEYELEMQIGKELKKAHCLFKRNEQTDRLLNDIKQGDNLMVKMMNKTSQDEKQIKKFIKKACTLQ